MDKLDSVYEESKEPIEEPVQEQIEVAKSDSSDGEGTENAA